MKGDLMIEIINKYHLCKILHGGMDETFFKFYMTGFMDGMLSTHTITEAREIANARKTQELVLKKNQKKRFSDGHLSQNYSRAEK